MRIFRLGWICSELLRAITLVPTNQCWWGAGRGWGTAVRLYLLCYAQSRAVTLTRYIGRQWQSRLAVIGMHRNLRHGWDWHTREWHCCSCQWWRCYRVRVLSSYERWMDTLKKKMSNSHAYSIWPFRSSKHDAPTQNPEHGKSNRTRRRKLSKQHSN